MTSKLVVNTIEADTGISSVSFASSISLSSTSVFHFGDAGVNIGADTNISRAGNGILAFNINSSEKARIDSSGHLSVNTTTKGLATYGEDLTIASSDHAGITLRTGTGHKGTVYFSDGTSGDSEYKGSIQYDHSDDSLRLAAGGSERLRIDSSGRLLLGTTIEGAANANNLTIASSGSAGMTFRSGSSNSANIYFSDATSGAGEYVGYIQYHHPSDYIKFGTAGADRFLIDSSGEVFIGDGLGSANRSSLLSISGAYQEATGALAQLGIYTSDSAAQNKGGSLVFGGDAGGGTTRTYFAGIAGVKENSTSGNYAGIMKFYTRPSGSTPVERMRIHSAGYVTTPQTPSWMLRPTYASNQTTGGNAEHAIGWSSSDYGTHARAVRLHNVTLSGSGFGNNLHNGQNVGKITVPVAGIYKIWCTIRLENNPTAGNIYLYVDGSKVVRQHVEMWGHRPYMHGRVEQIVSLSANSYIIWTISCSGATVSGVNDIVNWCGGHLIG